jgi:DNA polymerase (family 10)
MYEAGGWVLRESALADLPSDLRWLYESGVVSIDQLATIASHGLTSTADLDDAAAHHDLQQLPGLTSEVEHAIVQTLPTLSTALRPISLGRAVAVADPVLQALQADRSIRSTTLAGSVRRGLDMVDAIEVVAPATDPSSAFDSVQQMPDVSRTLHRSARRLYVLIDRVQVGIRCPAPESAGAALLHLTGSIAHFERLRQLAASRGLRLDVRGLRTPSDQVIGDAEEAVYAGLDLPWIPPEIRDGKREIDLAMSGTLPALVTRADIKGDLHMHTDWSDGRDSVSDMAHAAAALGYRYIAITDHSPRSATRSLTADNIKRQAEDIAAIRERLPQLTILHGCEVDILPSGRLDFSDRILEGFDVVLASLHEHAGHGPSQLMQRYRDAMRHPLVSVITHPTNRQLPQRAAYELDYQRLFELAVETGTAVEVDGAPTHLDMNGTLARIAVAAGATIVIDSDCHRTEMLGRQMDMGVQLARNGWVEARHVLNTRDIDEVRARIHAKRGR